MADHRMKRRFLLLSSAATCALFAEPATTWALFLRGRGSPNTLLLVAQPVAAVTSGGLTATVQITLAWSGSAPSLPTALWSSGGGIPTVEQIAAVGNQITYAVSTPASPNTYSLTLTGTGANIGSVTATGISISTAIADFSAGIHGPTSVMLGIDAYSNIGSYLIRGTMGPVSWSLSDTGSGDSAFFTIGGGSLRAPNNLPNSSYSFTIHAADAFGGAYTLAVTVQNPSIPTATMDSNYVLDSSLGPTVTVATVTVFGGGSLTLTDPSGLFSLPGVSSNSWFLQIASSSVASHIGSIINIQLTVSGQSPVTYPVFIAHESPPFQAWIPAATVYSSTPPTSGYGGINASGTNCNQIGTVLASADSGISTNLYTSNPSGLLNTYNADPQAAWLPGRQGWTGLLGSPSVGTLAGTIQTKSGVGLASTMLLTLPVIAGTTMSPSAITIVPVGGLTNYSFPTAIGSGYPWNSQPVAPPGVTLNDAYITGNTLFWSTSTGGSPTIGGIVNGFGLTYQGVLPIITSVSGLTATINWPLTFAGPGQNAQVLVAMPTTVANVTVTGFTPNWLLTTIDVASDNCQTQNITVGTRMPRYALYGTGPQTAIVTAWEGSAVNETTPKVDVVTLTLTDGNGTYCQRTFNNSVSWHPYTGAALSVGPSGSGATWTSTVAMQTAIWAAPATYAGATIKILKGVDTAWSYNPYGGSSYGGYLPCPLHFVGDPDTKATFTGTISSVSGVGIYATGSLAVSGLTGTINLEDFILISGTKAGIIIKSGSGPYVVAGPGVTAMSSIAMTTQHQQIAMDFTNTQAPADNSQGALNCAGGFDIIWERVEVYNVSDWFGGAGSGEPSAGGIYITDGLAGDITIQSCYVHDCNNGVFNGDYGRQVRLLYSLFAGCGTFIGNSHNIYISTCANATIIGNVSADAQGHEFKCRSAFATITGNSFLEGCNWFGFDSPFQNCQGGVWTVTDNIFVKGGNGGNANNGNTVETNNECFYGADVLSWADNLFTFTNNTLISTYATGQLVNGVEQAGIDPTFGNTDGVRNIPYGYNIANNSYFNIDPTRLVTGNPAPPSSGNTVLSIFPFPGTDFINPLTGAQPTNSPRPVPGNLGWICSEPLGSTTLGPYTTIMRVPTGSPSGTNVIGGLISGYASPNTGGFDSSGVQMTSTIYSTNGSSQFSVANASPNGQLKTIGVVADGIYNVQVSVTGTSAGNALPGPQYNMVIVE